MAGGERRLAEPEIEVRFLLRAMAMAGRYLKYQFNLTVNFVNYNHIDS